VERAQVVAELQEPGPGLARLDVPKQFVLAQFVGGEQMPDPSGAGVGGAHPPARRTARLSVLAADRGPLPPRAGLEIERPEFIHAEDDLRLPGLGDHLPVGDRV